MGAGEEHRKTKEVTVVERALLQLYAWCIEYTVVVKMPRYALHASASTTRACHSWLPELDTNPLVLPQWETGCDSTLFSRITGARTGETVGEGC